MPLLCSQFGICFSTYSIHVHVLVFVSQGKEVASQIKVLPVGTVQFDDVSNDQYQGAVKLPVVRSFTHGRGKEQESTPGLIIYQSEVDG